MKAFGRWLLFVVVFVACLASAYAAYTLANYSWSQVADYKSPYVGLELPIAGRADALTPRTVYVIIDGLTEEMSRDLDTVERLRPYGADFVMTAGQPSLSYPNWTNLLSGAPAAISGVTTNDYVGPVKVETLFQTAERAGAPVAFVGPNDFEKLYDITSTTDTSFMRPWSETKYMSALYVDNAIKIAAKLRPRLLVVHLPDIDEAGHRSGSASEDYQRTARKVDGDLGRLVTALQDGSTIFVVASDHGHIGAGGHGGWESLVTSVPAVFSGPGIPIGSATGSQSDVAPTVALLAGVAVPRFAEGVPLKQVVGERSPRGLAAADEQRITALDAYSFTIADAPPATSIRNVAPTTDLGKSEAQFAAVQADKLAADRETRLRYALGAAAVAVLLLGVMAIASWRALISALAGTAAFYAVYNLLFFVVHGYTWSLSVFNRAEQVDAFINMRVIEAAAAGVVGVAVAALVYPLLRARPKPPRGEYLAGWLTLGPTTLLVAMVTLAVQAAVFVWQWGIVPTWRLPDLRLAVKYDFDLLQIVGLGAAAILAPLVTYLVGRYHPKVRRERTSAAS
jgi:Type I phosphodiesterase / nucleotide pyrophosphatase